MRKILYFFKIQLPIHVILLFLAVFPDITPVAKLRGLLLSPFFGKCGSNLQICAGVHLAHIEKIKLGNNVFLGKGCWISGFGDLIVESNVMIGPYCVVETANHIKINNSMRFGAYEKRKILIGEETWIGARSIILPGAKIGNNTIIGAGSILTSKVYNSNCLFAGVPAKVIKNL